MEQITGREYYVSGIAPALLQHPTLSPSAKLLACCLLMHRNRESGLCYPTHETLALENGVTVKTVSRALAELRKHTVITWENREAPKGAAKGRANLYDLRGLDALRQIPIATASAIADRTKTTTHGERTKTTTHRKATGDNVLSRQDKNDPSLRTNRVITVNSKEAVLDSTSVSDSRELAELKVTVTAPVDGGVKPREAGERTKTTTHSARTAQAGPLKGVSARVIREQLLAPDGESAEAALAVADGWFLANAAVEKAQGEPFNPGDLSKLCEAYGDELVWFHAKWFPVRLSARKKPPRRPTAFFVKCVRNDYDVNPAWLDHYREPERTFTIPDVRHFTDRGQVADELDFECPF